MKAFVKEFIKEVATLKRPVTAASVAGTILALVVPFGLHLSAVALGAALVIVGTLAALVERIQARAG